MAANQSGHQKGGASGGARAAEESESGSEATDLSNSDNEQTWISWFCSLRGNEFFCEVDEEYIQDDFNLSGLSQQVPYYDYALDQILDMESPNEEILTEEQNEMVQSAAEMLYGLIHQRYILSSRGMQAMLEKFRSHDFGTCPRVFCNSQPCLPVGQSDIPRNSTVKVFCPKCEDIYLPRTRLQSNVDGAYFGTTFPHLFLLTYLHLKPQKPCEHYVPRIFGFKIHPSAWHQQSQQQQQQSQHKQPPPPPQHLQHQQQQLQGTQSGKEVPQNDVHWRSHAHDGQQKKHDGEHGSGGAERLRTGGRSGANDR